MYTDIRHVGVESLTGAKYMITFVCDATRHTCAFFLAKKSDASGAFREYLAFARREGYVVKKCISDAGGEYWKSDQYRSRIVDDPDLLSQFERVCHDHDVTHIKVPAGKSELNPIAERAGKKIFDIANAMMYHACAGVLMWEECCAHAIYLINRMALSFHLKYWDGKTAHELVTGKTPSYARIRVWGCDVHERLRNGPLKSEPGYPNARKLIYLGVSPDEKSFRCLNPETREIVHAFDVKFDESMSNRRSALRSFDTRMKQTRLERENSDTLFYNDFDDGQGLLDMRSLFNNPPPEDPHDSARPIPIQLNRDGITSRSEGETSSQQSVHAVVDSGSPHAVVDSGSPHAVVDSGSQPVVGTKSSQRPTIVDCEDKSEISSPDMVGPDVDAFHNMYQQAARSGPLSEGNLKRHQSVDLMNSQFHTRPLRVKPRGKAEEDSKQSRLFRKIAFEKDFAIKLVPNPKRERTLSRIRYDRVQDAESCSQYLELAMQHASDKGPEGMSKALKKAKDDFAWDFLRGHILFPGRESVHTAHYVNYNDLNKCCGLVNQVGMLDAEPETPQVSFHDLIDHVAPIERQIKWIESKEHSRAFSVQCFQRFMASSRHDQGVDLAAHLPAKGYLAGDINLKPAPEPNQYHNVKNSPDRSLWEKAMAEELATLNKMGTYEMIPQELLPPDSNIVDCRYVYKIKYNSQGEVARYKARLVARGFTQRAGVDYDESEVYAPVCSYESLRTALAIATANDYEIVCADIKNAYLIGKLTTPVYMRQPPGPNQERDKQGRPKVLKLLRPLYGLKNSGHIFANVLHEFLHEYGLKSCTGDRCFFRMQNGKEQLMVLTYVDDLTVCGSKAMVDSFMSALRNRFVLQESETGEIDLILSMVVKRNREKGILTINQEHAITKLAKSLGITQESPSVTTPMKVTPMIKLTEPSSNPFGYLNAVGSLLHIAQVSRPDIAYAVGALGRHAATYGPEHVKAVKRCVQYLFNTRHLCIKYERGTECDPVSYEAGRHPLQEVPGSDLTKAFVDADYAMDIPTRRSTSGAITFMCNGPIQWSSRLQKTTAQSTAEAEINAATELTKELVHLKLLLSELGVRGDEPIPVHEDNQACILMGNGMKSSRTAKHYEVRLHLLQESIKNKTIQFKYCKTDDQVADAFTKPLDEEKFLKFRGMYLFNNKEL